MRILVLAQNLGKGGGITHLEALLNCSSDIEWIVYSREKLEISNSQVKVIFVSKRIVHKWLSLFFGTYISIIRWNIDAVFVPGGICLPVWVPVISMCQNMLPWDEAYNAYNSGKYRLLRFAQRVTFKYSSKVIFLTDYALKTVTSKVRGIDGAVISHGIEIADIVPDKYEAKILVYVSRFEPYKMHLELLDTLKESTSKKDWQIIFIGQTSNINYYNQLKKHSMIKDGVVEIIEDLSREETLNFMKKADRCLFYSRVENLPFILLEKLILGKPCLSLNLSPMKDVSADLFLVDNVHDVSGLDAFLDYDFDDAYRLKISEGVKRGYDLNGSINSTIELFINILDK